MQFTTSVLLRVAVELSGRIKQMAVICAKYLSANRTIEFYLVCVFHSYFDGSCTCMP